MVAVILGACLASMTAYLAWAIFYGEPDHTEQTREFVNDLSLGITPRPTEKGGIVTFLVDGEPPIRLRARRYVDLLAPTGEPLFRLDASLDARRASRPVRYPLPDDYSATPDTVSLRTRQRVRLPVELAPGRYELRGEIFGRDRFDDASHQATPSGIVVILPRQSG